MFDPVKRLASAKNSPLGPGVRTGLLANQTSFSLEEGAYLFEILPALTDFRRLFLPEHGLFAELQDQLPMTETSLYRDFGISVPIVSLYGDTEESLTVNPEALRDLDLLIVDLQDVGSRYYTFATTLSYIFDVLVMEKMSLEILVLDRPNPAGRQIEGTRLPEGFRSFVGRPGLPHRHGLTLGELARFYKKTSGATNRLFVLSYTEEENNLIEGMKFGEDDTGFVLLKSGVHDFSTGMTVSSAPGSAYHSASPWVIPPSPNMPAPTTPLVYSGQCLLEGTNLSEGRGTTRPFEIFGAPYLRTENRNIPTRVPGALLRRLKYIPTFHKWSGQTCEGFQIHLSGEPYHSLLHTLEILRVIKSEQPEEFAWRDGPYEFRSDRPAIELLAGDPLLLEFLESRASRKNLTDWMQEEEEAWIQETDSYRIYSLPLYRVKDSDAG